ncbi:MAG TPA: MIP family channel protein [Candidatus Dormibacteraeota bacterium]|nr:MIP family channel protein [Candidatus Dormibacteraeota bacterium]
MYNTWQKLASEFLGTFALVFFGEGAACADQFLHGAAGIGIFGVALAHGFAFAVMISALGRISGGHFNPAVTIGFWVTKRLNTLDVILYWAAQLAGAVAAAFLLRAIVPWETWHEVLLGTPEFARDFPRWAGMALEATATFFLVLVVFAMADMDPLPPLVDDERSPSHSIAGFSAGLVYALGIVVCAPFTGGALNPARAFGPALAATHWHNHGVYWVGPLAGGFAAALVYDSLFVKKV